ncbi:MAG: hypothetical protein H0V30_00310 [Chitinophagaceae bacterium]|jgi:flagellar basal body-associated protein FliL|nr:hypothetical protein [Chitinophagaceae bacterium]
MAQEQTANKKKNRSLAWIIFFISTVALAVAIITHWEWLTLIIPFWGTSFVIAMDLI